ncbi:MAG: hypothetical protein ACRDHO_05280 [Actinomycetota bacterium]
MNDPTSMLQLLAAEGPHLEYADQLMLFGRLVGSWDLDMTAFDPDGSSRNLVGEWRFGWVLGGRAVQDVLVTRSPDGKLLGFGSTLRSFDPKAGVWWIVWQDPLAREFGVLLARPDGEGIVLDGQWSIGGDDKRFRWAFSAITADSFHWEGRISDDGGRTWRLAEEMQARRRAA